MAASVAQQVTVLKAELDELVDDAVKIVAVNGHSNLVEATPVDTGWAKANWQVQIGSRPENPLGSPTAIPGIDDADAKVASYTADQGMVFVSNPVPYIARLDGGHSQQAAANFVRRAVEEAVEETSQILQSRAARRGKR